jgi:hypothetical protein
VCYFLPFESVPFTGTVRLSLLGETTIRGVTPAAFMMGPPIEECRLCTYTYHERNRQNQKNEKHGPKHVNLQYSFVEHLNVNLIQRPRENCFMQTGINWTRYTSVWFSVCAILITSYKPLL